MLPAVVERAQRVAAAARAGGADWALLTSPDAIYYATGHEISLETGPSAFAGGPTFALVGQNGPVALAVDELEHEAAVATGVPRVRSYESLGFRDLRPLGERYLEAASAVLDEVEVAGTVGVERGSFPASLLRLVERRAQVVVIDDELARARAIKTDDEVERLRRCAALTGVGQRAASEALQPGRTELEAFHEIRAAMEDSAGCRLVLAGDLISGPQRTAGVIGWPSSRRLREGDSVICDLVPRLDGYWGDSCKTFFVGEPSPALRRLHDVARQGLELVAARLRPGLSAGELDAAVRGLAVRAGATNSLHLGHGIGTSPHEWPRIVPASSATIEAGMVLMIEPGAYVAGSGGVRLEWMFHVTESGNDLLSPYDHEP